MAETCHFYGTSISCGVQQLYGVGYNTPSAVIRTAFRGQGDPDRFTAHIVFSDVFSDSEDHVVGGQRLAEFIKERKLGTVVASPGRVNPNSGNRIKVWVWTPHRANLRAFLARRKVVKKV